MDSTQPTLNPEVEQIDIPPGERLCRECRELYSPSEDYDGSTCSVCVSRPVVAWTDLGCGSPETARAIESYLNNELFDGEEDPPVIRCHVEKSTLRVGYVDQVSDLYRARIDNLLIGYRDGHNAANAFTPAQLTKIRETILSVIDEGDTQHKLTPLCREWKFYESLTYETAGGTKIGIDESYANAQRLDFRDEVMRRLKQ